MRTRAVLLGLVLALLPCTPAPAQDAGARPDLAALTAELEAVTARAEALAAELEAQASRDGGLRAQVQDLEQARQDAQARLDMRVRETYMAQTPGPVDVRLALVDPALAELTRRGRAASVRVERELVDAVSVESGRAQALRAEAEAFRAQLVVDAAAVLEAQEQARVLLGQAREVVAQQQAAEVVRTAEVARLAAVTAQLDAVSQTVTLTLTPAQTRRSRDAAAREAPLLAIVEAAGSGYPVGWVPSGQVITGVASWYGPGFVGSPTATGTPYDPERQTCAHKTLPFGTVLHVVRGPYATNCLVNDRGPFVGDRVLDLSRAGSRALGFDGVAPVVIEVLTPG